MDRKIRCTARGYQLDVEGGICPNCGGKIIKQKSAKGRIFFGCENYPKCKFVSWDEPVSDICPKCGNTMFKKKGKKATIYCAKEGCGYSK